MRIAFLTDTDKQKPKCYKTESHGLECSPEKYNLFCVFLCKQLWLLLHSCTLGLLFKSFNYWNYFELIMIIHIPGYWVHQFQDMKFISFRICGSPVSGYADHQFQDITFISSRICGSPISRYAIRQFQNMLFTSSRICPFLY